MVDLEYVKGNLREGWMLNPNEKIVNGIIKGILNKLYFLMKNNENKYKKFINFENNLDK